MKLAPHLLNVTPDGLAWARNAPGVKAVAICMDNDPTLHPFKVAPPNAIRIFRNVYDIDRQNAWRNGADLAREIIEQLRGYRHPNLYIELFNEMGRGAWKEQARQCIEAAPYVHAQGIKLLSPCWSTGDYEADDWRGFIEATRGYIDGLAVHAYWATKGFTIWNALRFTQYWRPGDPPVFITECGRDTNNDGDNATRVGEGGWRKCNISAETFIQELVNYNAELEKLPYVVLATPFTHGAKDGQWKDYDLDGVDCSRLYATASVPPAAPDAPSNPGGQAVSDYTSPNNSGAFAKPPTQIVVHATRGGTANLESEFDATVRWFDNPQSGVSAHAVVSPTRTARPVPPDRIAWHCLTRNRISLGIEFCQARLGDAIPDAELRRGAEVCAEWCVRYGIPTVWALDRGFAQHKDTPEGQQVGKSDIGPGFDGDRFMAYVRAEVTRLTAPKPDPVTDALNGCWHFATMVEAAPTLAAAKQAATSLKAEVVELKQALGRA
jgi:hypothetical protein